MKDFNSKISDYIKQETVVVKDTTYTLTEKGKLLADKIASELFV